MIIHVIPYYKPAWIYGGPIQSVSRLAEEQAAMGAKVMVLTTTANGNEELGMQKTGIEVNGVLVHYHNRVGAKSLFFAPGLCWLLFRIAKKTDVIHIHTWWNLTSIFTIWTCLIKGINPIFSPRGMLSAYSFNSGKMGIKRSFQNTIGKYLLKGTVLHATSLLEATECLKLIPNWPFFVLPNILDIPSTPIYPGATKERGIMKFAYLSRIHPKKGLDLLFEALAQNKQDWCLSIAGEGEEEYIQRLKELSLTLNIEDKIQWIGWVNSADRYNFLADQDLFLLTSHNENFANVVVESLAVGTPVLISGNVGLSDYVAEKKLGWVTELHVDSIAQTILKAQEDKAQRHWIRQNAPEIIRMDFSPEHIARQYLDEYQKILNKEASF